MSLVSLELGASLVATAGGALHAAAPVLATAIAHPTLLVLAGFAAGVLGGMLGIGGGILAVPALVYAAGLGQREAVATSLAAMVPMSLVAAARHHHYGNLRVREGGLLGVLGIAGAAVGASIAEVIPESALRVSFALLMIVIAVHLTHGVWKDRRAPNAGGAGG